VHAGKIRVLYVVSTLKRSGPTSQLLNLSSGLSRDRFEARVLTLSPESQDSMWDDFCDRGIKPQSLGLSRVRGLLFGGQALRGAVRTYAPHIIHTQGIRADTYGAYCVRDTPCIATLRTDPDIDYVRRYGTLFGRVMTSIHWRSLARLTVVVACADEIAALVTPHNRHVSVIYNGVDTRQYTPAKADAKLELRRQLGIRPDDTVFVVVGPMIFGKDPLTVVRAFQRGRNGSSWTLLFVGDGSLRQDCERESGSGLSIRFCGQVRNVRNYLQVADCLVSASKAEGLPNAVMEGLACGLPVCLSDISPHRTLLEHTDGAGCLFPVGDVDALAGRMRELTHRDPHRMRECALKRVRQTFSAERMANQYQELYESLVG